MLDLGPIRKRFKNATRGPWHWAGGALHAGENEIVLWPANSIISDVEQAPSVQWSQALGACGHHAETYAEANAEFIEHARWDIPALVREVERLRQEAKITEEKVEAPEAQKPPLGLMPKWRWLELRLEEVQRAIRRYEEACLPVPDEWRQELEILSAPPAFKLQGPDWK